MNRTRTLTGAFAVGLALVLVTAGLSASNQERNPLLGPFPTDKVTLTIWDVGYFPNQPGGKALKRIDEIFMKRHSNVEIKHVGFPFNAYWPAKVQAVISSKRGPDVLQVYPNIPFYKGLWPLRGLVSEQMRRSLLWFSWDLQDPSLHQIPWTTYGYFWLYNKALFRGAGLNPNAPPTTWAQLLRTCGRLKAAGITPVAAGFKDGWYGQWLVSFGTASRLFSRADLKRWFDGKIGWTSPKMRRAVGLLVQLRDAGCFAEGSEGKSVSDVQPDFNGKRAALLYYFTGGFADYERQLGKGNVGIFRMPRVPGQPYRGQPLDSGPNIGWAITRFTKNCRVAWEYLSFMLSPEAQRIQYEVGNAYPNNTRVVAKPTHPLDRFVLRWLKDPDNHTGPFGLGAEEDNAYNKGYPQLIAGGITVDQFLEDVQAAREKIEAKRPKPERTPRCT